MSLSNRESCFLWGARQTGKSTYLKERFESPHYYDLLLEDRLRTRGPTPRRTEDGIEIVPWRRFIEELASGL